MGGEWGVWLTAVGTLDCARTSEEFDDLRGLVGGRQQVERRHRLRIRPLALLDVARSGRALGGQGIRRRMVLGDRIRVGRVGGDAEDVASVEEHVLHLDALPYSRRHGVELGRAC